MENRLKERGPVGSGVETIWDVVLLIEREMMVALPRVSVGGDREKC